MQTECHGQIADGWTRPRCARAAWTEPKPETDVLQLRFSWSTRLRCSCVGAIFICAKAPAAWRYSLTMRRASSFVSSLAADRPGVHELIADVSFQPQQPLCDKVEEDSADNHRADHHQPKQ